MFFFFFLDFYIEICHRKYRASLAPWRWESSSLQQQQKRPASSPPTSIHRLCVCPGSLLLLEPQWSHSERDRRRTKPRREKWPFNTWENNPEETWSLCIFPSSSSSSSLPSAASSLLLTGNSVSEFNADLFSFMKPGPELLPYHLWSRRDLLRAVFLTDQGGLFFFFSFLSDLCQYCISRAARNRRTGSLQLHLSPGKTNTDTFQDEDPP